MFMMLKEPFSIDKRHLIKSVHPALYYRNDRARTTPTGRNLMRLSGFRRVKGGQENSASLIYIPDMD